MNLTLVQNINFCLVADLQIDGNIIIFDENEIFTKRYF